VNKLFWFLKVLFPAYLFFIQITPVKGQIELISERISRGKLIAPELTEVSGIVSSSVNQNCFWTHNDSGDLAQVYLIDSTAKLLKTYSLESVDVFDVEDIARIKINDKFFLILADIGDNRGVRKSIQLIIFEEPIYQNDKGLSVIPKENIEVKKLIYQGKPKDAEAIFVDPVDHMFYLISKREFQSTLYVADIFSQIKDNYQLKPLLKFPFTFITAADISDRGDAILMKSLTKIYYWRRNPANSILEELAKPYKIINYQVEPQGEAICFPNQSAKSFFTISERPLGLDSYLYYYKFKDN